MFRTAANSLLEYEVFFVIVVVNAPGITVACHLPAPIRHTWLSATRPLRVTTNKTHVFRKWNSIFFSGVFANNRRIARSSTYFLHVFFAWFDKFCNRISYYYSMETYLKACIIWFKNFKSKNRNLTHATVKSDLIKTVTIHTIAIAR